MTLRALPRGKASARKTQADAATRGDVLTALKLPGAGRIYDLDSGRWAGMPQLAIHPPFLITSYRTPRGTRVELELPDAGDDGDRFVAFLSDLVVGTTHTGTHVDALSHVACGAAWHGAGHPDANIGDFGPVESDAAAMPAFVTRGVLVDAARTVGTTALRPAHTITWPQVCAALEAQGTALRPRDVVLVRTGFISEWLTDIHPPVEQGRPGIDLEAATKLADAGVVMIGSDTDSLEVIPSRDAANPAPVHTELLIRRGVYILELAYLEELARERIYEFLFVCLPPRISGGTGAMVRPVAIA